MYRALVICVYLACACADNHYGAYDHRLSHSADLPEQPVTVTPSGEIRGAYNTTRRGRQFESYRGVRYAEPPVGELRFQPPKPILNYPTPVDATEDGPACPRPTRPGVYQDEDCLTINVYAPLKKDRTKPLPVIVFLHPGAFYTMSGRSDVFGPHYLLDRDIVLVTINYRIGSLGFLSTGDEYAPGNNGMRDQVAALRWVQRNIAAFGGDPNNVTIAGCSAGSKSVVMHVFSPMSKGLFHRAISMSGSPLGTSRTPTHLRGLALKQAEILNCPTSSSKAIVDCLKTKHWKELGDSLLQFFEFGYDPMLLWKPVVEQNFGQERFLSVDPLDAIHSGDWQPVPFLISQTHDEFAWKAFSILRNETLLSQMNAEWERVAPISFMLPGDNPAEAARRLRKHYLNDKPLANDTETARILGRMYADDIVAFPVQRLSKLLSKHSPHPVYYYEWAHVGNHSYYEDPTTGKPTGAFHHDDLIYLFTMNRFPDITVADTIDSHMVDRMTAIWYNFARYGDPNPRGDTPELDDLKWPAMTPTDRTYLRLDYHPTVHKNLFEEQVQIFEDLYPIDY